MRHDKLERIQEIWKLICLAYTCLDIIHAVCGLDKFMHISKISHMNASHKVLRFLKSMMRLGLMFRGLVS